MRLPSKSMTIDAIRQNIRDLYRSAHLDQMFPDLMDRPLSWQVGAVGMVAGMAGEKAVMSWADRALQVVREWEQEGT